MRSVLSEFTNRRNEIKVYIDFLSLFENDTEIIDKIGQKNIDTKQLRRILISNVYLLMYNLVESSIRNSIQQIYDHFKKNDVEYDKLISTIQTVILHNVRSHKPSTFQSKMTSIAKDIVHLSFDPDKISSGNIDAQKIRDLAKTYGFSDKTDYNRCKNGVKLLEIKNKRNDLAHGIVSFSECGKDIVLSDVTIAFGECSEYLENIMTNVEDYLDKKVFLR